MIICLGCAAQPKARTLVPAGSLRDKPSDSTNDSRSDASESRAFFRIDSSYAESDGRWFISARVPNVQISGSKTLSSDFGNQIEIMWGARRETLQLETNGLNYVLLATPVNASEVGSLFNSGVKLLTNSGSDLSNQIAISSRPFANPLTPNDPADYDLSNCFGSSGAPNVSWPAGPVGTSFQIQFDRNDTNLKKTYPGIRDELGRWNEGIANRDLFRQIFSASERAASLDEEFVADVERALYRQQALNSMTLNTVPRLKLNSILEVVERRAIFVYYLGSCE